EADASHDDARRAPAGPRLVASVAGSLPRTAHGTAGGRHRGRRRAGHALEPCAPRRGRAVVSGSLRPLAGRRDATAVRGRPDRLRPGDATVKMDRVATAHLRAADEYLPQSH